MTPPLETPRLWLRALELADAEQAQPLFAQWEVVRYLTNQVAWPFPSDGVYNYYRDVALPAAERGDAWHWTLRLKSDPDRLVGCISLVKGEEINRGFWLGSPWHGQGLMTEACDAGTDYWFETLGFPLLRVPKAAANTASRRISERQGMRIVETKESEYVSGRLPTEVWRSRQRNGGRERGGRRDEGLSGKTPLDQPATLGSWSSNGIRPKRLGIYASTKSRFRRLLACLAIPSA